MTHSTGTTFEKVPIQRGNPAFSNSYPPPPTPYKAHASLATFTVSRPC